MWLPWSDNWIDGLLRVGHHMRSLQGMLPEVHICIVNFDSWFIFGILFWLAVLQYLITSDSSLNVTSKTSLTSKLSLARFKWKHQACTSHTLSSSLIKYPIYHFQSTAVDVNAISYKHQRQCVFMLVYCNVDKEITDMRSGMVDLCWHHWCALHSFPHFLMWLMIFHSPNSTATATPRQIMRRLGLVSVKYIPSLVMSIKRCMAHKLSL